MAQLELDLLTGYISLADLAEKLECTIPTVNGWVCKGEIPIHRLGKKPFVKEGDFREWFDNGGSKNNRG